MSQPVSGPTKVALGVVLPVTAFVLFDLLLFRSVGGKGEDLGFAGMVLYFKTFIIVPVLLIVNAFLMRRDWKSKAAVLLTGLVPPTAVALYEYYSLYGYQ
jgi:hypothetical protein